MQMTKLFKTCMQASCSQPCSSGRTLPSPCATPLSSTPCLRLDSYTHNGK